MYYYYNCEEQIKNLPSKEKKAILGLIDIKVSNDMKEVLAELKSTREILENRLSTTNRIVTIAFTVLGILIGLLKFIG